MILGITKQVSGSGKIEVSLRVVDKQEYPSQNIFRHSEDYPASKDYRFDIWECAFVWKQCKDQAEYDRWLDDQIKALRGHLEDWRRLVSIDYHETAI